jgi:hypothetical protein
VRHFEQSWDIACYNTRDFVATGSVILSKSPRAIGPRRTPTIRHSDRIDAGHATLNGNNYFSLRPLAIGIRSRRWKSSSPWSISGPLGSAGPLAHNIPSMAKWAGGLSPQEFVQKWCNAHLSERDLETGPDILRRLISPHAG